MSMTITPEMPAMPPPDGQESNFVDPPDYYGLTLGVGIASMAIMTISMFMRTYTKAIILRNVRHEDYIAVTALLGFLTWNIVYIYCASMGFTRDLWNITALDMIHLLYLMNVAQVLYGPAMLCAKYFIIIQLKRIFCPSGLRGPVWWALHILVAITISYYVSCFFVFLLQCTPRERIWNPTVDGTCVNNVGVIMSAGIINLALDIGILVTPIWAIWHLHMPLNRKIGVISIFAVGFITCGMAAAGVAYRVPLMTAANQTNAIAKVGLWTFAEFTGTIVVGCMPVMPRFYEISLKPGLSRLSRTSLKSFISSGRTKTSKSGSSEFKGSTPSVTKPVMKIAVGSGHPDLESGHDYIELREPSTTSTIYHDHKDLL